MADDRLPCLRSESMLPTRSDSVTCRLVAISFNPRQNASSRLTLVLCPAMTMERLTTGDFIARLLFRSGAGRGCCGLARAEIVSPRAVFLGAPRSGPVGRNLSGGCADRGLSAVRDAAINDVAHA